MKIWEDTLLPKWAGWQRAWSDGIEDGAWTKAKSKPIQDVGNMGHLEASP